MTEQARSAGFRPFEDPARPDVATRFHAAWSAGTHSTDPDLLPTLLTRACVDLLGADGAGLSLHDADFRVPLGASDSMATTAEQFQYTVGEGPCLDAGRTHRMLVADRDQMNACWPAYAADLLGCTPYTAVVSLPFALAGSSVGALDLFYADAAVMHHLSLADAAAVTDQITQALTPTGDGTCAPDPRTIDEAGPTWLRSTTAHARAQVWVAAGMAMAAYELQAADAIALLRSYAYGHGSVLDAVALALVDGELPIDQIMA